MAKRNGTAHVVTTTRKVGGKEYHSVLLRRSFREDGKVKNETLGNLSHLSPELIDIIRRSLKGESFISTEDAFTICASRAQGHVRAVTLAMDQLDMATLLGTKPSRERDLVLAMIAARILSPATKLATARSWDNTTLGDDFKVSGASEDELYAAMDWLLVGQDRIQKKLATRHLHADGLVLYDLSSSYFEGTTCPLAHRGYSRDGMRGTLQVNYGLLTNDRGCPVAISVHEGNTADSATFMPAVHKLRDDFGIRQVVMVGDRGMISQKAIGELREMEGMGWITALKHTSIRALVEQGQLQMDLFDERNLVELTSPDYPGERLMACRNEPLARKRAYRREELLVATEADLTKIQGRITAGKLTGSDAIGIRVGKVIDKHKMAKHFDVTVTDSTLSWERLRENIASEAALDGVYIIRTSLAADRMDGPTCVRSYKSLSHVERAFRSIKTMDLKVRPIHHRLADRVRAHIFLCMLAYYVEWHMREAWRELLFTDTEQGAKATRDPVAPATRSASAKAKAETHALPDGTPVHSFTTLMANLATIVRNTCRAPSAGPEAPTFTITTTATQEQMRAFELLKAITL